MKEDKLSQEELLQKLEIIAQRGRILFHFWKIGNYEQAIKQIKSLLTPVPEEKLRGFIDEQAEIMCNLRSGPNVLYDYKLPVKIMLKAYDGLKKEK